MSSFEWMELQTLTADIELSRSRLADARKRKDQGRIRALEDEITRAEKNRLQLLAHISTNIATTDEPVRPPKAKAAAEPRQVSAPAAEALRGGTNGEQPLPEPASAAEPAPLPDAGEIGDPGPASDPVAEALPDEVSEEQPLAEPAALPRARARGGDRGPASAPAAGALSDEVTQEQPLPEPIAEVLPGEADAEQPLPEPAGAAEPAPLPQARHPGVAPAPVAEALPGEATEEQPLPEPAGTAEPAPLRKARTSGDLGPTPAPVAETLPSEASGEAPLPEPVERIAAGGAASPTSALKADGVEGGMTVWNQLTPSDIEHAKNELNLRRAETLARHAEELKGLEAEQGQLATLEQAIDTFLRKFNRASPESEVVKLDQERELRQQGNV